MESFGSSFRDIYIPLYEDKERRDREYDIILIGVKSKKIFEEIKKELKDTYNVPDEQMYWEENYMESIYKDVYLG